MSVETGQRSRKDLACTAEANAYQKAYVADLKRKGQMPENGTIKAGRLGDIKVKDREVLLGEPISFNRDNVDKYDF